MPLCKVTKTWKYRTEELKNSLLEYYYVCREKLNVDEDKLYEVD